MLSAGYLLSAFCCISFISFVLGRNEKSPTRNAFVLQVALALIWQLGTYFVLTADDSQTATIISRVAYIGCIFLSVASFHVIVSFLDLQYQKKFVWFGYAFGAAVFIPQLFSNLLIDTVYQYSWGYWFHAGPGHPIFLIFFCGYALATFMNLLRFFVITKDAVVKRKLWLLLIANVICYFSVIDFFPDYGYDVFPLGFLFVNLYLAIVWFIIRFYDFFAMWKKAIL